MHKANARPTPFDELPGWWNRLNGALYRVLGPAQLGAGHDELPARPAEWRCPMCDGLLSEHEFERASDGHTPTRMHCPKPQAAGVSR